MKKALVLLMGLILLACAGCASGMRNTLDTLNNLSGSLGQVQGLLDEGEPAFADLPSQEGQPPASPQPADAPVLTTDYIPLAVADLDAYISSIATGTLSYCMNQNGVNIVHGAVGKANEKAPATVQSAYNIQEVSQLVTGMAVMELVQKNRLQLDTPAANFIQGFTMKDKRYANITLGHLLSHTSGINGAHARNEVTLGEGYPAYGQDVLAFLANEYVSADPGALSSYSSINYVLAGRAVEQAARVSYAQYITENIFTKYALNASYHPSLPNAQAQSVRQYNDVYQVPLFVGNANGANDLWMSAWDLSALGKNVMQAPYFAQMTKNYTAGTFMPVKDSAFAYGYGFGDVAVQPFAQMGVQAHAAYSLDKTACLLLLPQQNLSIAVLGTADDAVSIAVEFALSVLSESGIEYQANTMGSYKTALMNAQLVQNSGIYATGQKMVQITINEKGELWMMPYEGKNGLTWSQGHLEKYSYRENGRFSNGSRELYFVQNGALTYLCVRENAPLAGAQEYVLGQKLQANAASASFAQRNGAVYLAANNQANAVIRLPMLKLQTDNQLNGYVLANGMPLKIASEKTAAKSISLPAYNAQSTLYFFEKDGAENAQYNGTLYVQPTAATVVGIDDIFEGATRKSDEIVWFVLPEKSKHYLSFWGKARYICMDFDGNLFYDSLTDGNTEYVRTPKGGYLGVLGTNRTQYRIAARRLSDGESEELPQGANVILKAD